MADEQSDRLRQALQSWLDRHPRTSDGRKLGVQTVANEGKFSESAARHFLRGDSASMSERIYGQFAAGASTLLGRAVTVTELKTLPQHQEEIERPATSPEADAAGAPRTQMMPAGYVPGPPDVPVWASAEAGSDGAMVLVNEPIDWIRRSERLQNVKSPFAFQTIGSSMSPAIEHGDQLVINPALHPVLGKDHVFLQYLEDGTILALVKRLLRSTATSWRVRQFNPSRDFDLPKRQWSKAHVISERKVGGL